MKQPQSVKPTMASRRLNRVNALSLRMPATATVTLSAGGFPPPVADHKQPYLRPFRIAFNNKFVFVIINFLTCTKYLLKSLTEPGTKEFVNLVRSCKILERLLARRLGENLVSCLGSYLVSFLQALARRSCKNSSKILQV